MSYCLNLRCPKPQNPINARFCSTCGSRLLLGERYRALKPISQGGIGRTFLAVDEQDTSRRRCIIKQFSPKNHGTNNAEQAAELFRQEAMRLQELGQHSQIPQLVAYFESDNQSGVSPAPAIVQTLIEGESLAQKLEAEGAFSETKIRQLLAELLPVLQFVHDRSVIHRDINPENIIYRTRHPSASGSLAYQGEAEGDELVLVDFSAAKFTSKTALAKTGTVIGSAAYTAQEQLMGKAVASSDLYSVAVICIHLLTHIHPFDLFNSLEGIWVWQDYLSNPVSPQLTEILNKMLNTTVKHRYQSAAEILKDLEPEGTVVTKPITFVSPSSTLPTIAQKSLIPTWQCVRTLKAHLSSINSMAFSPDGQTLASGSADRTIKLWSLDSNIPLCTFSGHSSLIDTVAFSPDGRLLASGSWDHTIKIWNLETRELIHTLQQHSGWIKSITISPDGKTLASGSADRTIKIWNVETVAVQKTLSGHSSAVHCLAMSPDGQTLASGSADQTIKIWDLDSGEIQRTLDGHSDAVNALTFSPSGQILITGSTDKTIKIWHLGSGMLLHTLNLHSEAVNSVAINLEGNLLISGSTDKTIKIWHPARGELLSTLSGHLAGVTSLAFSSQGDRKHGTESRLAIASGSQDKTIKIWQFE